MAVNSRVVKTTPDQVWEVLADGWLYPLWVVGATRMRAVDGTWPQDGAKLHHSVGVWPAVLDDNTEVLASEPGRSMRLRARGWPLGEAEVSIRLTASGAHTLVELQEDVVSGPGTLVPEPVKSAMIKVRNVESLRRLAYLAEGRAAAVSHDAVVIGAGPNGLVAANHLLDKGWSVLVLEAQPEVGGAVRSAEDVAPGFVHDTFSAFYPLAAASPTVRSFGLEQHGLRWRHAPAVLGHPRPDGSWALLHRDRSVTARLAEEDRPGDGAAWLDLCADWDRIGDHLVGALVTPFPPVRSGLGVLARLRSVGGLDFVKTLLTPASDLGRSLFDGTNLPLLLAGNAGHADIPLDAPGSGLMALLLTMLGQTVGFPVPEGGAGELSGALARRIESLGGDIRCSTGVTSIEVVGGRATGVRTEHGETLRAGRAVIADVAAPNLYGGLLRDEDVPVRTTRAMRRFQLDPSTVKVDWALDGPVPWASTPAHAPGTVHVADSLEQMTESLGQVAAHAVPDRPFLLAGQMTTTDPTRSPRGTESMWAYTHVPQRAVRDAGDGGIKGDWGRDDLERFADRMQGRIEELAPGFGSRVLARRILGPHELEARDANLIGGAINGGTSQLHQELVFRPVPGLGRAETPVRNLYLGSASAHPGGGVHGAPGMNAARAAVAHARLRPRWRRGSGL